MRYVLLFSVCIVPSFAQNIEIPDVLFKSFLISQYDGNGDGEISQAEAAAVTGRLDCSEQGIADLTGISFFSGLTELYCHSNQLTVLPSLSSLTDLIELRCHSNRLAALPNLNGLTNLARILCARNQLTALPSLSGLTNLTKLFCAENQLTTLPDLSGLTSLDMLSCSYNLLTALPDLSGLTSLRVATLVRNHFSEDDCPDIRVMNAGPFILYYNPQSDGTTLICPCQPPTISTQSTDLSLCLGSSLQLTVIAEGTAPLSYQWIKGTTAIANATSPTLEIPILSLDDADTYYCEVNNTCGTASMAVAYISVDTPLSIDSQPNHAIIAEGEPASFTVAASGTPLSYQWYRSDTLIAGATTETYTISAASLADQGDYSCALQNSCGTVVTAPANLSFMSLTVPLDLTGSPSSSVEVPLLVQHLAGAGFSSFDFTLNYDSQKLQFTDLITEGTLSSEWIVFANSSNPSSLRIIGVNAEPLEQDGTLLLLRFAVDQGASNGDCSDLHLQNALFGTLAPNTEDGRFCVTSCLKGDADGNGLIQANDASLVLRVASNLPTAYDPIDPACIDVDCDGQILALDGALISLFALGLIHEFCSSTLQQPPTPIVQLKMEDACLVGGQRFSLGIYATPIEPEDRVISYQFTLAYDEDKLSIDGFETEGTLSQGWRGQANDTIPGRFTLSAIHSDPLVGGGLLVRLNGVAWQTEGRTELKWEQFLLGSGIPAVEVSTASADIEWNEPVEDAVLSILCPRGGQSRVIKPEVFDPNRCDSHHFTILSQPSAGSVTIEDNGFRYRATSTLGVDTFSYTIEDAGGLIIERDASVRVLDASFFEAMAGWPAFPISGLIEAINQPGIEDLNRGSAKFGVNN